MWNTFHSAEKVVPSLKKSLADLGLTYVDLYLIHWPMGFQEGGDLFPKDDKDQIIFSDVDFMETWKGMEECAKLGLAKSIGVSNFNSEQLDRILKTCVIPPAVNQVRLISYSEFRTLFFHGTCMLTTIVSSRF